jgi:hypothetical protein
VTVVDDNVRGVYHGFLQSLKEYSGISSYNEPCPLSAKPFLTFQALLKHTLPSKLSKATILLFFKLMPLNFTPPRLPFARRLLNDGHTHKFSYYQLF